MPLNDNGAVNGSPLMAAGGTNPDTMDAGPGQPTNPSPLMANGGAPTETEQPEISLGELEKGLRQTAYLNAGLRRLVQKKELPTRDDVFKLASDLVSSGTLSAQRVAAELADLPRGERELLAWLQKHFVTTDHQLETISSMIQQKSAVAQGPELPTAQPQGAPPGAMLQ